MTLTERLAEYVRACFTGVWIESHEHQDALVAIAGLCRQQDWQLATWDIEQGLWSPNAEMESGGTDPLAAIRSVNSLATAEGTAILVLQNFHRFTQSAEIVQALVQQIMTGKQNRTFVVVLSPIVAIPTELEKLFVVLEHELPDREQLAEIAEGVATEDGEFPSDSELATVLDAASGLSRFEAEGAYSLSLVRHGRLTPDAIWELKTQTLTKSGLLTLHRGGDDFSSLGGLSALKAFSKRALQQPARCSSRVRPRGVLLLSPPGCGKSQFCKGLGKEVGRPVLILDVGSLMGSLVGQSEERTRKALQIVDVMAPCVLMIDEIEKAFAGVESSGQTDSGVSARMFGTFLSWLNDHESNVFVVCTANDVSRLPPEFGWSERFDGIFFLDLPQREEKDAIWRQYIRLFQLNGNQSLPKDENWTGAEIRSYCRLASLLDLPLVQAAGNVVPVAVTAAESVQQLRTWAGGRCLDADRGGIDRPALSPIRTIRRVSSSDATIEFPHTRCQGEKSDGIAKIDNGKSEEGRRGRNQGETARGQVRPARLHRRLPCAGIQEGQILHPRLSEKVHLETGKSMSVHRVRAAGNADPNDVRRRDGGRWSTRNRGRSPTYSDAGIVPGQHSHFERPAASSGSQWLPVQRSAASPPTKARQ